MGTDLSRTGSIDNGVVDCIKVNSIKRIVDCHKCNSDVIKVVYNGDKGEIECRDCGNKISGRMDFCELMNKWNSENTNIEGDR